jgi:geranylgeranyl transferase type-1 subunit beta
VKSYSILKTNLKMDFKQLHKKYFQMNLKMLPHHYTGSDTNRMTLGMFMIMSLELLGIVDEISSKEWVDWIYSMQLIYKQDDIINAGFRGGPFLGDGPTNTSQYDAPHLTMTYSALLSLFVLKDDMSRLHRQDIIDTLSVLQKPDGRYCYFI